MLRITHNCCIFQRHCVISTSQQFSSRETTSKITSPRLVGSTLFKTARKSEAPMDGTNAKCDQTMSELSGNRVFEHSRRRGIEQSKKCIPTEHGDHKKELPTEHGDHMLVFSNTPSARTPCLKIVRCKNRCLKRSFVMTQIAIFHKGCRQHSKIMKFDHRIQKQYNSKWYQNHWWEQHFRAFHRCCWNSRVGD